MQTLNTFESANQARMIKLAMNEHPYGDPFGGAPSGSDQLRGNIFANGRYQFDPASLVYGGNTNVPPVLESKSQELPLPIYQFNSNG